jgi:hypothetical protein
MNKGAKITRFFIVFLIIGVLLYDLWVFVNYGNEATISRQILDFSYAKTGSVMLAFFFGLLCGHLFIPQHVEVDKGNSQNGLNVRKV